MGHCRKGERMIGKVSQEVKKRDVETADEETTSEID